MSSAEIPRSEVSERLHRPATIALPARGESFAPTLKEMKS